MDDIAPEGALFGYVVRSSVAHGKISNLDLEDARHAAGVHVAIGLRILWLQGLQKAWTPCGYPIGMAPKGRRPFAPFLPKTGAFVGEPIAFIVADTLDAARDAGEMVLYNIDELPVHLDLAPCGEALHEDVPANLAFDWAMGDERDASRFCRCGSSCDPRGGGQPYYRKFSGTERCYAEWDGARLHTCEWSGRLGG